MPPQKQVINTDPKHPAIAREIARAVAHMRGLRAGPMAQARRDWWVQYLTPVLALLPASALADLLPPNITDEEYEQRTAGTFCTDEHPARHRAPQTLILQTPSSLYTSKASPSLAYDRFMAAVGQRDHWTAKDGDPNRAQIVWEDVAFPRWSWVETPDACPRTGTSWNDLTALPGFRMPSLEEYTLSWHATRHEHNRMFDVPTWCLLRTRFGPRASGALRADGAAGRVCVRGWDAADLGSSSVGWGSRASDPVKP
ncbi:MAG: hypothetical protein Q7S96_03125 [bacterium]|nr:hypothetical protein [bacterium]